jgi:branched-chain amino acid transport system permease protein
VLLGVARLVNFGHGQMYMIGAFMAWWATAPLGLPYPVAVLVAVGAGILLGLLVQAVMLRLTLEQNLVSIMIVTLGFGHVLRGAAALLFGGHPADLETPLSLVEFEVAGAWVTAQDGLIVAAAIGCSPRCGWWWSGAAGPHGPHGGGGPEARPARGHRRASGCTWRSSPSRARRWRWRRRWWRRARPILTSIGFEEVIVTFVVVVLGGIGSVAGSYVAGVGLGLFNALFGGFVSRPTPRRPPSWC